MVLLSTNKHYLFFSIIVVEVLSSITNCILYKKSIKHALWYLALVEINQVYKSIIAIIWSKLIYYSYHIEKLRYNKCILFIEEFVLNLFILCIKTFFYDLFKILLKK